MSTELLVTLTVVEVVVLVAVLALFVILITNRLRSVANALKQVSGGNMGGDIPRIQANVGMLGAGSALLNRKLDVIASLLPAMTEKVESMASKSPQTDSYDGGSGTAQNP
jgi:hypothetical protein